MSCRHDLANGTCRRCYPETGTLDPGPEESYEPNLEGPGAVPVMVPVKHSELFGETPKQTMERIEGAWEGLRDFIADPQNYNPPTVLFTSHRVAAEEGVGTPLVEVRLPPLEPGERVRQVRRRLGISEDSPDGVVGPKTAEEKRLYYHGESESYLWELPSVMDRINDGLCEDVTDYPRHVEEAAKRGVPK